MKNFNIISLTPQTIKNYGVCGYKDVKKHKELVNKIEWFEKYHTHGLNIKILIANDETYQGMIEYLPGEFAHRPVNAQDFMFIHCIFVGFKKEHKGKGYATALIEECISDAKKNKLLGVAVVSRKSSFMADNKIFLKMGFKVVDKAKPDFELLAMKFDDKTINPSFKSETLFNLNDYKDGLTIMRSPQCPYTEKNVVAIIKTAKEKFGLQTNLIELDNEISAQNCPSPFGTFCLIYNGEIISYHPISCTRFENIMQKEFTKISHTK